MNPVLSLSKVGVPSFLKRRILGSLFEITGRSFSCCPPDIRGLGYSDLLELYSKFSRDLAEESIESGNNLEAIGRSLFEGAYRLGSRLKNILGLRSVTEGITVVKIIYGTLGIDFEARDQMTFVITRCYFSDSYSPEGCELMSNLDRGLVGGLTGGSLEFQGRMTEGGGCCSGRIDYGS
jgi:hypothetical protein